MMPSTDPRWKVLRQRVRAGPHLQLPQGVLHPRRGARRRGVAGDEQEADCAAGVGAGPTRGGGKVGHRGGRWDPTTKPTRDVRCDVK